MTLVRWLLLAALVATVMALQAGRPGLPDGEGPNPTLRFEARYAVGAARLAEEAGRGLSRGKRHELYRGCDHAARAARDRIRVVPVAAELAIDETDRALAAARHPREGGLDPGLARDLDILERIYGDGGEVTDEERARLVARHGWFGRLAATWSLPEDDPARQAPRAEAMRAASGLILLMLIAIAVTVGGFVLLAYAVVRRIGGKLAFRYEPAAPSARDGIWLDAVLGFFVLMLGLSALGVGEPWLLVVLAGVVFLPRLAGASWADWRAGAGWQRGAGLRREIGCGLLGWAAGAPILLGGTFVTAWLAEKTGTRVSHPIVEEAGRVPWAWVFFTAVVWAPVVEETLFRGLFYRYLRARMRPFGSVVIVGLVFAAVHPQGWTAIPALGAVGAWLAVLREWRGSVVASMVAHAMHNGTLTLALYLTF